MIDPLYTVSGFGVGALVGLTGVGGGSLTPLLVLLSGSVPGVIVGSLLATRVPVLVVHGTLPATLALVAGKLLALASPHGRRR